MSWLIALLAVVVAIFVVRREREKAKANIRTIADWTRHLLDSGTLPPTGPIGDAVPAQIASDLERISEAMHDAHRNQSANAANLEAILCGMAEGVMVVDSRHIIRRVNPSLLRVLDVKADPLGQNVFSAVRDRRFGEIVAAVLETGRDLNIDISLHNSNSVKHLAVAATPIRAASGESTVLLICHDITRLRQLEDVRREFVANVSHELRTPLAIFQGYVENLLDNPDLPRSELLNVLQILHRHSDRLNALVEDLLVLARLESGPVRLRTERLEPCELINGVVRDWQNAAQKKQITLTAECADGSRLFDADAFRIEQALHNLIDNALKHTAPGGRVTLSVAPSSTGVEFRVTDTGIGISPADLPHIFERFYSADKARSRERGGTGLGLSIVKHIVQLHHGSVGAESAPGQGTTIRFEIPLGASRELTPV
jgi:two-component system phosphate regulon sensor histidine kinase PhoR